MTKKLPVFAALEHSFRLTFDNLGAAFRFSWAWILAIVAVAGLSILAAASKSAITASGLIMMFSPLFLLAFLAVVSIAVVWHRYILRDEGTGMAYNMRADGMVWRYLGNVIAILISSVVLAIPFGILGAIIGSKTIAQVGFVFVMPVVYRMSIKLPAIALGEINFNFKDAMDYSTGNYWPLLGLSVIVIVMSFLLDLAGRILLGIGSGFGTPGVIITSILAIIPQLIFAIFSISMLTTLYGFFIEDRKLG